MRLLRPHTIYIFISICIVLLATYLLNIIIANNDRSPQIISLKSTKIESLNKPTISLVPIKNSFAKNPQILARNVALYDVDSGTFLYGIQENIPVPIASITKVMTAVLSLEQYNLDDTVVISKEAVSTQGSVINLRAGETMSVESLLYGLLIPSGNDAAYSLAEHSASKSESVVTASQPIETFVNQMNEMAQKIGLTHTHYKDPAGLDDSGTSTARDQGLLIAYALRNEMFRKIINTPETIIYSADQKMSHALDNSNRLVKEEMHYDGIIGGKTGFTPSAGHTLITAAKRDGHTLVAVVFNTYDTINKSASAVEARKLLDWGFVNFTWLQL